MRERGDKGSIDAQRWDCLTECVSLLDLRYWQGRDGRVRREVGHRHIDYHTFWGQER